MIQGEYQDILKVFSRSLNFHIRQFKRIDGYWGSFIYRTNRWNGMISNIVNGEADLITTAISSCCKRSQGYIWLAILK